MQIAKIFGLLAFFLLLWTFSASAAPPSVIHFPLWVRDFQGCPHAHNKAVPRCSHWSEFEPGPAVCNGLNPMFDGWSCPLPMYHTGMVLDRLGADGTPQWNTGAPAQCLYPGGKANFDEFFHDTPHSKFVPGITADFVWAADPMSPPSGKWGYVWDEGIARGPYFPIEGKGWGNYCWFGPAPDPNQNPFDTQRQRPECVFEIDREVRDLDQNGMCTNPHQHNFHFSDHLAFDFKYDANNEPWFRFQGDDDTYLYINGQLVMEVSGIDWCVDVQSEIRGTSVTVTYKRICDGDAPDRVLHKTIAPMVHNQNYRLEWFHVQRKVDCSHHAAVFGIIPTCPPGSAGQKCGDDTGCYQWMCNNEGHCEKSEKPNSCSPSGPTCTRCDLTSPTGACVPAQVCTQPNGQLDQCKVCSGAGCAWGPAYTSCNDDGAQTCRACNPNTGTCTTTLTCDKCHVCSSDRTEGIYPYLPKCTPTTVLSTCADDGAQVCKACDPSTGACTATKTCNKCQICQTGSRTDGAFPYNPQCVDSPAVSACVDDGAQVCRACDPNTGNCSPTKTCDKCHTCRTNRRNTPWTTECVVNQAYTGCLDSEQECKMCNGTTGTCDIIHTCSKCETCHTDRSTGKPTCVPIPFKCDVCSKCVKKPGDPTDGTCALDDNDHCDPCHTCKVDNSTARGFQCVEKVGLCGACERCTLPFGHCDPLECKNECLQCDASVDMCMATPNVSCGAVPECSRCGFNGTCEPTPDVPCHSAPDNDSCRNPFCDAHGGCTAWGIDPEADGKACKPAEACRDYLCINGTCTVQNHPVNTSCTIEGIDRECQVSKCDGNGACVVLNHGPEVSCDAPLTADVNTTLCHHYQCSNGSCAAVPREEYTNCTHRTNVTDTISPICDYMTCVKGQCVYNHTLPTCVAKGHAKTGVIVGATIGAVAAVALILAAVVAAFFIFGGSPAAGPAVIPADVSANANLLINPTYTGAADGTNPLYNQL